MFWARPVAAAIAGMSASAFVDVFFGFFRFFLGFVQGHACASTSGNCNVFPVSIYPFCIWPFTLGDFTPGGFCASGSGSREGALIRGFTRGVWGHLFPSLPPSPTEGFLAALSFLASLPPPVKARLPRLPLPPPTRARASGSLEFQSSSVLRHFGSGGC